MNENKSSSSRLKCGICGLILLKKANFSGKPYAVRQSEPVICDRCVQQLADIDDENQGMLEAYEAPITNFGVKKKATKGTIKPERIDINKVITDIKAVIKGQDEAVSTIATAVYTNYTLSDPELKSNLIILGDSGSGKTKIIKMLTEIFNLPYVIEDATRYTEAGYVGEDVDSMLKNLYAASGYDLEKAQKGILVIDEGDKKAASNEIGRDVSGESVLFSLLKIVEGTKIPMVDNYGDRIGTFDTKNLTVIFIGAFPRIASIREKRLGSSGKIGFSVQNVNGSGACKKYTSDDFIQAGFPKEFVGRFDTVVELNSLLLSDYVEIIKNSSESTLNLYKKVLEKRKIKLIYTDEVIAKIAQESKKLGIGARGIKRVVQDMMQKVMFKILSGKNNQYSECTITEETVTNYNLFLLK